MLFIILQLNLHFQLNNQMRHQAILETESEIES